jgi:hypothetical protein
MATQTAQSVDTSPPPGMLPRDRGHVQDGYFDPAGFDLGVSPDALGALQAPGLIPDLGAAPQLDLGSLGASLPTLPSFDLGPLQDQVSGLLSTATAVVGGLSKTLKSVASGVASGSSTSFSAGSNSSAGISAGATSPIAMVGTAGFEGAITNGSPLPSVTVAFPFDLMPGDVVLGWYVVSPPSLVGLSVKDLGNASYSDLLTSPGVKNYTVPASTTNSQGAVISGVWAPGTASGYTAFFDITFMVYRNVTSIVRTASMSGAVPAAGVVGVGFGSASAATSVNVAGMTGWFMPGYVFMPGAGSSEAGFTPRNPNGQMIASEALADNIGSPTAYYASFKDPVPYPRVPAPSYAAAMVELGSGGMPPIPPPIPTVPPSPLPTPLPSSTPSPIPPNPGTFRLTTTAGGTTQTFNLLLCIPTPINMQSTNQLTPTTIVSLCPVPLGIASHPMLPSLGQPAQLYLSAQRIATTAQFPAKLVASYDLPGTSPLTLYFGMDSGSQNYPDDAVVGAATDYNPATNTPANHVTMGWALDGFENRIWVGANGVGELDVNQMPANSGSLALSRDGSKVTAQFTNSSPFPAGSTPSVTGTISQIPGASALSAVVTLTNLPQDFTLALHATEVDGKPSGFSLDGNQSPSANLGFSGQLDLKNATNGQLVGRVTQSGFGSQFSESVEVTRDQSGNFTGISFQGSPGVSSNLAVSTYQAGQLAAFAELGAIPATGSEFDLQLHGTPGTADVGVSMSGTNTPAFIGAGSYLLPNGSLSASIQISLSMSTGAPYPAQPFAVGQGAWISVNVSGLNPTFKIEAASIASGDQASSGGVQGFDISGSTPGGPTAGQILAQLQADPSHRINLVFNSLPQQWEFKAHLHGTTATPTGVDISDTNTPDNPTEYKEIYVTNDNGGGNYVPQYTLIIQRPASNTSGSIAPGGVTAVISSPPQTFDLSFDYSNNNADGVCNQGGVIQGSEASASPGGSITLSAGAISLTIANEFVQGKWSVSASAAGPSANCSPDTFTFNVHQNTGGNTSGQLTAGVTGKGQITLQSFATTTNVTVKILKDDSGNATGARVDGDNSEANPTMQIHLKQFNGSSTPVAVNIWGSTGGTTDNGDVTAIVVNAPQVFGLSLQKTIDKTVDSNTKVQVVEVNSYNPAPAPNEGVYIYAPAGSVLPGGKAQLIMRSLDTSSQLRLSFWPATGGSIHARIQNANVNSNPTQAISVALFDSGGSPYVSALFARPSADLTGLPTSGTVGVVRWQRAPNTFDLTLQVSSSDISGVSGFTFSMNLQNAQASDGVLTLTKPSENEGIVFNGTGASQALDLDYSGGPSTHIHGKGTVPTGLDTFNIQAYKFPGDYRDKLLTIWVWGATTVQGAPRGTSIWIQPTRGQSVFELTGDIEPDSSVHLTIDGDVAGGYDRLTQYYQMFDANHTPCWSGGSAQPCTEVTLNLLPRHADMTLTPSSKNNPAYEIDYSSGTESTLILEVNALVGGLGGYADLVGLPKTGMKATATLGANLDIQVDILATGTEPLPYFDLYGWGIQWLLTAGNKPFAIPISDRAGLIFNGYLGINVGYSADVALKGDQGLTEVKATTVKAHGNGPFAGLVGAVAKGADSSKKFDVGIGLALNPGTHSIGWWWEVEWPLPSALASDSDGFTWTNPYSSPLSGSDIGLTSYAWEAVPNDDSRYSATGCGTSMQAIDMHPIWPWTSTIPFQPSFAPINNGLEVCAGHVAYYQLNPQDVLLKHCGNYTGPCPAGSNPAGTNEYSYGNLSWLPLVSDWMLAVAMKKLYTTDPAGFTMCMTSPSPCPTQ